MVAKILTFVFSALLHEYLATFIFRTFAPVLSFFMLLQIPLIQVTKWMRKKRSGIYLFWFGILQGSGLIIAAYLRVDPETTKLFTT
jgi:sterol O-acyltransferase